MNGWIIWPQSKQTQSPAHHSVTLDKFTFDIRQFYFSAPLMLARLGKLSMTYDFLLVQNCWSERLACAVRELSVHY